MALSNESKMKLNLKSGFLIGNQPAQSPPVGLKITHGKPNFTINKGVYRNDSIRSPNTPYQSSPFGVTLKKTLTPIIIPNIDNEEVISNIQSPVITSRMFSTPSRTNPISPWGTKGSSQVISRSTSRASNYSNGSQNEEDEEPEFLRAHRKMAAKIINVDYEEINRNRNSYTEIMNVSSPRTSTPAAVVVEQKDLDLEGSSDVEIIENDQKETACNGQVDKKVKEVVQNCNKEKTREHVGCNGDDEETKKALSYAEQLNELMAKSSPAIIDGEKDELKKQIDQTIDEAVQEVENQKFVDENGNTLAEDLDKLKLDIQNVPEDITMKTVIIL